MLFKKNGSKLFERIISAETTTANPHLTTKSSVARAKNETAEPTTTSERILPTKSTTARLHLSTSITVEDGQLSTVKLTSQHPSVTVTGISTTTAAVARSTTEGSTARNLTTVYYSSGPNSTNGSSITDATTVNSNTTSPSVKLINTNSIHSNPLTTTEVPTTVTNNATIFSRVLMTTTPSTPSNTTSTFIPTTELLTTIPVIESESMANLYCDNSMCKKASAKMAYMLNYKVDRCSDFYDYACGGGAVQEESFFDYIREDILMYIKNNRFTSKKHIQTFRNFYQSCREHMVEYNFRLVHRLQYLKPIEANSINELFMELIVTQSMPFFDIGVGISNISTLEIELTPPGQSTLRNSISNWSLMESIQNHCLEEEIRKVAGDQFDMDVIFYATKHCSENKTLDYVERFAMEFQALHDIVGNNVDLTFKDTLLNLLSVLKDDSLPEKSARVLTMKELNADSRYDFGLDWNQFFRSLNIKFDDDTPIKMKRPDYLENVFRELTVFKSNLTGIFGLWYNVQLYKNTVVVKQENKDTYCLDLTSQLMPDVTASIVYDLGIGSHRSSFVAAIFKAMKARLGKSFEKSNMTTQSLAILKKRLDEITLWASGTIDKDELEENYNNTVINDTCYQDNVVKMMRKYRTSVLGLLGADATPDKLAAYFLNSYEIRPKAFYPTKNIVFHPGFLREVTNKVPLYVTLAQMGVSLAQELAVYFEKNDYVPPIAPRESMLYNSSITDSQDALDQLTDNVSYTFGGHRYLITASKVFLENENVIRDDMAFRLITDWFEELKNTEALVWLNETFTTGEIFLITTAQDYCAPIDMYDFASVLYKSHQFPAPMKIKNMMRNSDLFLDTLNCHSKTGNDRKSQFPYDAST